jgi:hypothetical protein
MLNPNQQVKFHPLRKEPRCIFEFKAGGKLVPNPVFFHRGCRGAQ